MSILDIIIAIPLLWGAYKGYTKGLLRELMTLIAFVLGILLGFKLMNWMITLIAPKIGENNQVVPLLAFAIIFIGVVLLVGLLSRSTKKILDKSIFGKFDDFLGAIMGILKWGFLISVVLWLFDEAQIVIPSEVSQDSVIFPFIVAYGPKLMHYASYILPFTRDLVEQISTLLEPAP